jgi:hypothetical protein
MRTHRTQAELLELLAAKGQTDLAAYKARLDVQQRALAQRHSSSNSDERGQQGNGCAAAQ